MDAAAYDGNAPILDIGHILRLLADLSTLVYHGVLRHYRVANLRTLFDHRAGHYNRISDLCALLDGDIRKEHGVINIAVYLAALGYHRILDLRL